jgi:hypothetical protein
MEAAAQPGAVAPAQQDLVGATGAQTLEWRQFRLVLFVQACVRDWRAEAYADVISCHPFWHLFSVRWSGGGAKKERRKKEEKRVSKLARGRIGSCRGV